MTQLALDIFSAIDVPAVEEWTGSSFGYTDEYRTVEQHQDAFEAWVKRHGQFGCLGRSSMWHLGFTSVQWDDVRGHSFVMLTADTRRSDMGNHKLHLEPIPAGAPVGLLYQVICERCAWRSIHERNNDAVNAWHDHALPGWRDLPVIPAAQEGKRRKAWVLEHYPADWQFPNAPTRSERNGRNHAMGDSNPWGGFDIAVLSDERSVAA